MDKRLPLTGALIIKNEEEFLRSSLESLAPWVSELVIVDFGSSDKSLEIAESFRTRVPRFVFEQCRWPDHFADARNQAAKLATEKWILFVDGDEVLDANAHEKIGKAIASPAVSCYSLLQRNYTQDAQTEGVQTSGNKSLPGCETTPSPLYYFENWMERLYRTDQGLIYTGRIHESLLPTCQKLGLTFKNLDVILHHYGRLKKPREGKSEYYLELTQKKLKDDPSNPAAWLELIVNLMELNRMKEAYLESQRAVQKFSSLTPVLLTAFQAALRAEEFKSAENWIQLYLRHDPKNIYARSQLTNALLYQGRLDEALQNAEAVLKENKNDFVSHVNAAVIFYEKKDWKNALRHVESALHQRPSDSFLIDAQEKIRAALQSR